MEGPCRGCRLCTTNGSRAGFAPERTEDEGDAEAEVASRGETNDEAGKEED